MPQTIKPFQGTYYNQSAIKNISEVICPPYDVIDTALLDVLKNKSPYNFSNVLLNANSNYKNAGKKFRQWLKERVLIDDKKDNLYLYEQNFHFEGKNWRRFGIFALLNLNKKAVLPHEHTLDGPKEDRKKILKELKTNLSPIFAIIPKRLSLFLRLYNNYAKKEPFLKFNDLENNENSVWKIEDDKEIAQICKEVTNKELIIADGHHRYEAAYNFFCRHKGLYKDINYILAFITDYQEGLLILPTHRVISIKEPWKTIIQKLKNYFYVEKITEAVLEKKLKEKKTVFTIGMYSHNNFYYLTLKNPKVLNKITTNALYKQLDTYILHKLVFNLFNINGEIKYTHTTAGVKEITKNEKVAFILKPISLEAIFKMANKGYRLPQKSTYFYPKVISGIVMRRFKNKI